MQKKWKYKGMNDEYQKFVKQQYINLDKFEKVTKTPDFISHFEKWGFFNFSDTLLKIDGSVDNSLNSPGRIFLYEEFNSSKYEISYPKIGIYVNSITCDQTLEIEWVNWRRTWEYNKKCSDNFEFCNLSSVVWSLISWHDDILIYGIWDKLPNWKELRKAYERTWWFHKTIEEKRDILLENLTK